MEIPKCIASWSVVQAFWGSLELVAGIRNRNIFVKSETLACGLIPIVQELNFSIYLMVDMFGLK